MLSSLRTALRHDVDHGDEKDIAKKMKRAGETFLKILHQTDSRGMQRRGFRCCSGEIARPMLGNAEEPVMAV